MALDSGDIRVAGMAHIYLAPLDTPFPAWEIEPATPWMELGYVTTDGITATYGREVTEIYAMQSSDPVRIISTRTPKTIGFAMMQQGRDQLILAMGGGSYALEAAETDVFRYTPPDPSAIDERAMLVEMIDGLYTYRWEYPRVQNREGVEQKLVREDATTFPVVMQILTPVDASAPFEMVTNDPAYAAGTLLSANGQPRNGDNGETDDRDADQNPEPKTDPKADPKLRSATTQKVRS
jgi:hypothetical protein